MYDYSNYGYSSYDTAATTGLFAVLGAWLGFILIFVFAICIVLIVSQWKLFKKAGKNGWEAIIPIYNSYVMFEICGYPGWYVFLGFIPFVGSIILIVFQIMAYISLAKKFGKSDAFGVCTVFFPYVCIPMLAFGSATYDESLGEHKNSSSTNNTISEDVKYCPNCGEKLAASDKVCLKCNTEV